MCCNKYRTNEHSLSIETLARACNFSSPPVIAPPLFLSNLRHVSTRSTSNIAFRPGQRALQYRISPTGILFDCPPFREPLPQDQLLRISQTAIARNPSSHLHLLHIPACMRKISCDSRLWQVQDASRLGELLIQHFIHLLLRAYDSSASIEVTDAYRGILTSNWILGSYAQHCGVRESMLSPPILPTDDLEERMARLANVPLAWIGMAYVCSSYDEGPIVEWTKSVILPLILDIISFLKRAAAVSHRAQSTSASALPMKPAYQSSRSLGRPLNTPSILRDVFHGAEPHDIEICEKPQDRHIRLEVEERSPPSCDVRAPSMPQKFICRLPSRFLISVLRETTWRPRRLLASSSKDFFLRLGFIRCHDDGLTVKLHPRIEKRKHMEDHTEREMPDAPLEKRARVIAPMPRSALVHLEKPQSPLSVVERQVDGINMQSQGLDNPRQRTRFEWPHPRNDAHHGLWGSKYFTPRTSASTSTKPRPKRSKKVGGPCLIRPHKGPCSRECPLSVGFTRLESSRKCMSPRSLTVAVQVHLAFKVLRKNGSSLSFVPKLMIS